MVEKVLELDKKLLSKSEVEGLAVLQKMVLTLKQQHNLRVAKDSEKVTSNE
jgi:hypothetical protein